MNPIIAAIEQRRREIGMSRYAAAERAGLYRKTVTELSRQRMPRLFVIEALAGAVGLQLAVEPIDPAPIQFVRWRGRR